MSSLPVYHVTYLYYTGGDKEIIVSIFTLTFDWTVIESIVEELSLLLQYIIQFHR